jgi:hypothetical protein
MAETSETPTLFSVAEELTNEVTSLGAIDEWLEARGIDPLEMRAFIDVLGGGDGRVGFYVQIGYELAVRKFVPDFPGDTV